MRIFVLDYPGHPFAVELSRELARRGHEVRHAFFSADLGPKGRMSMQPDDPPGFSIEPISIRGVYSKSNLIRRHLMDGRFGKAAAGAVIVFAPDAVLAGQVPANALAPLQHAAKAQGARFVLWVQDVFGLAAASLLNRRWAGAGRLVAGVYKALEQAALRRSDHVIAISEGFTPYLRASGLGDGQITVIPNWGPLSAVTPRPKRNPWSEGRGLQDKIVFAYTGTLGLKHNPQLIYSLAQAFAARPDVHVLVTCSGVGGEWLKDKARREPLDNLTILPLVPIADLPDLYGTADVLVGLLEADAGAFSAPSKILSYLCAGRAILMSAPLENASARTLVDAGAGIAVPAGDEAAFLKAAHRLAQSSAEREAFGRSGRGFAERAFSIARVAALFEAELV